MAATLLRTNPMASILSEFAEQAALDPGFPLVERGDQIWTRSHVRALARRIAKSAPAELGQGGSGVVALHCGNGPLFLAALLAIWSKDCVALLVDRGTPSNHRNELADAFHCRAQLQVKEAWAGSPADTAVETWKWTLGTKEFFGLGDLVPEGSNSVVKLTSGSTGLPRGILVDGESLAADEAALFRTMGLGEERILTTIPLSHSYGFSSIALAALRRNITIVQPETDNPLAALKTLRRANVTFFPSVPAWLEALVSLGGGEPEQLGTTRLVISAGAPLPAATAQHFLERFDLPIRTFYGASECGGIAFDRTGEASLRGALGASVEGVQLELAETAPSHSAANDRNQEGHGIGRVRVTSPAVATAYLDPTTSNEAPVSTPFGDSTASPRSVLTNDLGTLEEGVLMLVGRLDDVVNLKGKKVSPEEVERVITSIDGVHAAYVFAEPQDHRPNVLRLKALVAADEAIDRATILRQCRDQLADHKLPRSITVVSRLPVTERGKLDRTAARRLCRKI